MRSVIAVVTWFDICPHISPDLLLLCVLLELVEMWIQGLTNMLPPPLILPPTPIESHVPKLHLTCITLCIRSRAWRYPPWQAFQLLQ
jgi:hypothetical protein